MTGTTPATRPTGPAAARRPGARPVTSAPGPDAATRLIRVLRDHPCWSVFWDKAHGV
jgi:hypothetical protein